MWQLLFPKNKRVLQRGGNLNYILRNFTSHTFERLFALSYLFETTALQWSTYSTEATCWYPFPEWGNFYSKVKIVKCSLQKGYSTASIPIPDMEMSSKGQLSCQKIERLKSFFQLSTFCFLSCCFSYCHALKFLCKEVNTATDSESLLYITKFC